MSINGNTLEEYNEQNIFKNFKLLRLQMMTFFPNIRLPTNVQPPVYNIIGDYFMQQNRRRPKSKSGRGEDPVLKQSGNTFMTRYMVTRPRPTSSTIDSPDIIDSSDEKDSVEKILIKRKSKNQSQLFLMLIMK